MVAIELCAGAGGLSCGLRDAGIEILLAVERDPHAAATYRVNFPDADLIESDIETVTGEVVFRRLKARRGEIDVLIAGLPCQGFSESNRRTRTMNNPGNLLYRHVLRLLSEIRPRWFVIENVAGIATLESGRFQKRMMQDFGDAGYPATSSVLNAADFGVAQSRRRMFIVGSGTDRTFVVPDPLSLEKPTVRDAISDLPRLENGATTDLLDYAARWGEIGRYAQALRPRELDVVSGNEVSRNSARVLERYRHIAMGQNWRAIPRELMENYANRTLCHTGIYYRLCWDEQAKVIGNFRKNMLIHPAQDRGLSIREAARLQSFRDCHVFKGPLNSRQQQVGDAVPPRLAESVGRALMRSDEGT